MCRTESSSKITNKTVSIIVVCPKYNFSLLTIFSIQEHLSPQHCVSLPNSTMYPYLQCLYRVMCPQKQSVPTELCISDSNVLKKILVTRVASCVPNGHCNMSSLCWATGCLSQFNFSLMAKIQRTTISFFDFNFVSGRFLIHLQKN